MTRDSDGMSGSSAAPLKPEVTYWSCTGPGVGDCWKPEEKQREQGHKRKGDGRGSPLPIINKSCASEGTWESHLREWQGFNGKSWCERKIWRGGEGETEQGTLRKTGGGHICLVHSIQSRARDSKEE